MTKARPNHSETILTWKIIILSFTEISIYMTRIRRLKGQRNFKVVYEGPFNLARNFITDKT